MALEMEGTTWQGLESSLGSESNSQQGNETLVLTTRKRICSKTWMSFQVDFPRSLQTRAQSEWPWFQPGRPWAENPVMLWLSQNFWLTERGAKKWALSEIAACFHLSCSRKLILRTKEEAGTWLEKFNMLLNGYKMFLSLSLSFIFLLTWGPQDRASFL